MKLNVNNDEADGVKYDCKQSTIKPGDFFPSTCKTSKTARTNSWFFQSTHPKGFIHFHEPRDGFTNKTLCDWGSFCREVAIDVVMKKSEQIGGEGVVVGKSQLGI